MKLWWIIFLLAFAPFTGFQRIALRNQYAKQAEEAYNQKRYQEAAFLYEKVRQAENENVNPSVQLNLAHSYFHLKDYKRAYPLYKPLLNVPDISIRSMVASQLAVIEADKGNYFKALTLCKQALTTDETNKAARYNYELIQKYLILHPEKKKSPPPPQNVNQAPQKGGSSKVDPQGASATSGSGGNSPMPSDAGGASTSGTRSAPNGKEGTANPESQAMGTSPGSTQGLTAGGKIGNLNKGRGTESAGANDSLLQTSKERLQEIQMSTEKARQLLDAMRQEEIQFLQQLPRKKSKRLNRNTPDW